MMTVTVRFFGGQQLFTQRISSEVERALPEVHLPEGATVDDLLSRLNIATGEGRPLVAINGFYCRENATLQQDDRVQLMRTVAGGAPDNEVT